MEALESCPGCRAAFAPHRGPTHRYIGAHPACWAVYTALLAGQRPDPSILATSRAAPAPEGRARSTMAEVASRLLVDAYAAQHHGTPSPQAIQSVAVHLLALHGVLREGQPPTRALWLRRRALRQRGVFSWLEPPVTPALSIRHLFPGVGVTSAHDLGDYVVSVFESWESRHGARLAEWYRRHIVAD